MDIQQLMQLLLGGQKGQQAQGQGPVDFLKQFQNPDLVGRRNRESGIQGSEFNPFDNGFFKSGAHTMTPEARIASQGATAENQWAQLGGAQGVNIDELQRMNQARGVLGQSAPPRTDYGPVQQPLFNYPAPPQRPGSFVQQPDGMAFVGASEPGKTDQFFPSAGDGVINPAPPAPKGPDAQWMNQQFPQPPQQMGSFEMFGPMNQAPQPPKQTPFGQGNFDFGSGNDALFGFSGSAMPMPGQAVPQAPQESLVDSILKYFRAPADINPLPPGPQPWSMPPQRRPTVSGILNSARR